MNTQQLAETEVKIDITSEKINEIESSILSLGFVKKDRESIQDLFLERQKSAIKGWDFIRLRLVDEMTCIRTEKIWKQDQAGNNIRLENEKEVPLTEFEIASQNAFILPKIRKNFIGTINEYPTTISIDTLTVLSKEYCFLEVEIITSFEDSPNVRTMIKKWISTQLLHKEVTEALSIMEFLETLNIKMMKK